MFDNIRNHILQELKNIEDSGLYKNERIINSPQQSKILVRGDQEVINLCSNNYLGLANHPDIIDCIDNAASITLFINVSKLLFL